MAPRATLNEELGEEPPELIPASTRPVPALKETDDEMPEGVPIEEDSDSDSDEDVVSDLVVQRTSDGARSRCRRSVSRGTSCRRASSRRAADRRAACRRAARWRAVCGSAGERESSQSRRS